MSDKPLILYTLENCPNCEMLKEYLKKKGIPFTEQDMASADSLTDLRVNGVFVMEAPVLRGGDTFLTSEDLFPRGKLQEGALDRIP
ncbi:MAG: glutaredoxin family protein [Methanomicrobiales archaeon]|nr:glutaredoxin family protein [Methanomicrobiales archaeon]